MNNNDESNGFDLYLVAIRKKALKRSKDLKFSLLAAIRASFW